MPGQKQNPHFSTEEYLPIFPEFQDLDDILFLEVVDDFSSPTSSSSSSPIPIYEEEHATVETVSTIQVPQSECGSSTAMTATSEMTLDEDHSSQEDGAITIGSQFLPDSEHWRTNPIDEQVALLVNFLLFKYQNRDLITESEMLDIVIQEYEDHFPEILLKASELIEMLFGLGVKEVDPLDHGYILVIKLGLTYDGMLSDTEGMPKTSLLIHMLGVIFLNGNRATEEEVWQALNTLGVYAEQHHLMFGDPRKLVTEDLVQEEYLEYRPLPNSDPVCYEFVWGPRAHAEISKMELLEFICRVHEAEPRDFPCQYEEAIKDEEERAQAKAAAIHAATAMMMESSSATSSSCSHHY
ncbi:melanoma-associated antigen B16-like [Orycteropus afer afer]|uniref:Melanoma-associated antigen B16-like n=1 Tax=Orycteropus afer afer TaxID=1230840 RepID=A0A8B7B5C7_ORYAF|nr:melanoma-associated antigen B16-like [Orycteropus afer afer]